MKMCHGNGTEVGGGGAGGPVGNEQCGVMGGLS